jgi:hypothetical protein
VNKKKKGCGTISFTLEYLNARELPRLLSSEAEEDPNRPDASSDKMQSVAAPLSGVGEAAEKIASFYEAWQPLLNKIGVVVKIASTIAEVIVSLSRVRSVAHHQFRRQLHPYGQMVWSVISPALEVCIEN